jgi:flagellar hook-length control protein FliK
MAVATAADTSSGNAAAVVAGDPGEVPSAAKTPQTTVPDTAADMQQTAASTTLQTVAEATTAQTAESSAASNSESIQERPATREASTGIKTANQAAAASDTASVQSQAVTHENGNLVAKGTKAEEPVQGLKPTVSSEMKAASVERSSEKENKGSSNGDAGTNAKTGAETQQSSAGSSVSSTNAEYSAVQSNAITQDGKNPNSNVALKAAVESVVSAVENTKTTHSMSAAGTVSESQQALLAAGQQSAQAKTTGATASVSSAVPTSGTTPADPVMSNAVINQVIKAAKLQTFDGGAGMTIRLDPPHLGSVEMNISTNHGTVTAELQTSSVSAKQMLESDLPTLKQSLADAGINVDAINVSVGGNSAQGGNFQGHGSAEYQNNGGNAGSGLYNGSVNNESASAITATTARSSAGQLDYLA